MAQKGLGAETHGDLKDRCLYAKPIWIKWTRPRAPRSDKRKIRDSERALPSSGSECMAFPGEWH